MSRLPTLVFLPILAACAYAAPSGAELLDAIRSGHAGAVKRLIAAGAPADAADDSGASALMYAAIYADTGTLRLLLDHGANPNHADSSGGTALMWAIPDAAKVELLLRRGADAKAVSAVTGRTPLLIAAGRPATAGIIRLLLDRGADPNAADKEGNTSVLGAAINGDPAILKLLLDRGVPPDPAGAPGLSPLFLASLAGRRANLELLLARGARPARSPGGGLVSLMALTDPALFRRLVEKGADAQTRGPLGEDLLTISAAIDVTHPDVIRELLRLGLSPSTALKTLHTDHGYGTAEFALDWARRRGDTPIVRILAESANRTEPPPAVEEMQPLHAASPGAAIEKALPLLYAGGREFFKRSGCTSCHHNMLPALAFSLARAKGIAVDAEKVRLNSQQSVAWLKGHQQGLLQDVDFPGSDYTAGYLLLGLAADGYARDLATDAAVIHLASVQDPDGAWRIFPYRPPLESTPVTATAVCLQALRSYPIPQRRGEFQARIRRAGKWLAAYSPRTGEERAMRVLGLAWAGGEPQAMRRAAAELLALQRADGGWAQLDTLNSDAYATGQALYALQLAGSLPRPALDRGVRFLLATQRSDGSWHVRSRSFPRQTNYFDTGFPHGRDQWISAAGTSWACIGLTMALDLTRAAHAL